MNNQVIIKPESVDFASLVNNSGVSVTFQSKMLNKLSEYFTSEEQQWYVANLYVYLHYHQTNEFPINLENVFKMIGFAHKKNAKRTLENNFTKDEDYKEVLLPREQNSKGGRPEEQIMLNVDTFKNLCMMAKTEKGKNIRKYYVKLENIFHEITNEEKKEYEKKLKEQAKLLKDKDEQFQEQIIDIKNNTKSDALIESHINKRTFYLGFVEENDGYTIVKYGCSREIKATLARHRNTYGPQFYFLYILECSEHDALEKMVQTHPDLISRHIRTYKDNLRHELIRIDKALTFEHLVELVLKLHKALKSNHELLLEMEKSRQLECQLELRKAENASRQFEYELEIKSLECALEVKKLEIQLELKKLAPMVDVQAPIVVETNLPPTFTDIVDLRKTWEEWDTSIRKYHENRSCVQWKAFYGNRSEAVRSAFHKTKSFVKLVDKNIALGKSKDEVINAIESVRQELKIHPQNFVKRSINAAVNPPKVENLKISIVSPNVLRNKLEAVGIEI